MDEECESICIQPRKQQRVTPCLPETSFLNMEIKAIKEFKCYLEEWEHEGWNDNDIVTHRHFLHKYGNMKYTYQGRDSSYASYVYSGKLAFKEKPKGKKSTSDSGWGWCCLLVLKGQEFEEKNADKYEYEPIYSEDQSFQKAIACTEQDDNVIVLDASGTVVDSTVYFEKVKQQYKRDHNLDISYKKWCDYPDEFRFINPHDIY